MATAKQAHRSNRTGGLAWGTIVVSVLAAGALGWWLAGETVTGYARAGTAYGAKNACSCRHVSGRELASCKADFVPGMEVVFLSEDEEARSVTASVPLIHSETATFRSGFGCVLEPVRD